MPKSTRSRSASPARALLSTKKRAAVTPANSRQQAAKAEGKARANATDVAILKTQILELQAELAISRSREQRQLQPGNPPGIQASAHGPSPTLPEDATVVRCTINTIFIFIKTPLHHVLVSVK